MLQIAGWGLRICFLRDFLGLNCTFTNTRPQLLERQMFDQQLRTGCEDQSCVASWRDAAGEMKL